MVFCFDFDFRSACLFGSSSLIRANNTAFYRMPSGACISTLFATQACRCACSASGPGLRMPARSVVKVLRSTSSVYCLAYTASASATATAAALVC